MLAHQKKSNWKMSQRDKFLDRCPNPMQAREGEGARRGGKGCKALETLDIQFDHRLHIVTATIIARPMNIMDGHYLKAKKPSDLESLGL